MRMTKAIETADNPRVAPIRDIARVERLALGPLRRLIDRGYFQLETDGIENLPREGRVVYVGNHAGWITLDTLMGAIFVKDYLGESRLPFMAVQDVLFKMSSVASFIRALGAFPASWLRNPSDLPAEMDVFAVYPEGAEGNCKSFLHAYQMAQWRTGFVRLALARDAEIVPWCILGGEECLPALSTIRVFKPLFGSIAPLPLTPFPLPTRWKIIVLPPLNARRLAAELARRHELGDERAVARAVADHVRALVQARLDRESSAWPLGRIGKALARSQAGARA
jgi:1-acyl-sn-glycerol-3-phosphate acyltransferase